VSTLSAIRRDLVHAARSLAKARAFTFVCVLSLGIGMAPVIAIPYGTRVFTAAPPNLDTETLVELVTTSVGPRRATTRWSYPDYISLREADTGLSLTAWVTGESEVTLPESGERQTESQTLFVSSNYFETMGVSLARGPGFPDTTDPVVILGHAFWQKRLGAAPDIVGKTLTVDGTPHVVAGILPDAFVGHMANHDAGLFMPLARHTRLLADSSVRFDRSQEWVSIHGRLLPGASIAQADAAVSALTARLAREYPATNEGRAGTVAPYYAVGSLALTEVAVFKAVAQAMTLMPLLVVCLNISGLVQVRGAMRERELSIRQAIGASRGRLIQYLLAEAVLLAGLGAALAALVIFNMPPLMSWWMGEPIPLRLQEALRVDFSMIALCVGLCLGTSLLFGWLPAARFSRPVILTVLKDEAGTGGIRAGRVHRWTTAFQVAIAVPLLIMSGMSLERMRATATGELGFAADDLYAAPLKLDAVAGDSAFRIRSVRENLARTAGVASVTAADGLPLDFRYRIARVSRVTSPDVAPDVVSAHVTRVGDGYLETIGIPLLRGRAFTQDDGPGAEPVVVISKTLADRLFADAGTGDLIGRKLTFARPGDESQPGKSVRTLTIVGVTGDFPTSQMSTEREQMLLPLAQHPDVRRDSVPVEDDRRGIAHVMIVARGEVGESAPKMTAALENAVREVEPQFDAASIVTGVSLRQHSMSDFLTQSAVSGLGGGVILLLAGLGIYGVVGMMVSTRTREIAVRVALGASRLRVMGMIVFDVVRLIAPGVIVGLLLTTVAVRLNGGLLGVPLSSLEPLAYIAGSAVVILIAILASLAPARRAASVQPMIAMRAE
jgi:putative ABC transport system permease protein